MGILDIAHATVPAAQHKAIGIRPGEKIHEQMIGLEDAPQLQIDIDRDKASALGVSFDAINSTISTGLG